MVIGRQFTSHNGLDPHFFGRLEKKDESVQSIGVREGEAIHALRLGGAAEFSNGGDTPTLGVMRMDIEMDKISHDISPWRHPPSPRLWRGKQRAHQRE